jgi:phosphoserine phosphatase
VGPTATKLVCFDCDSTLSAVEGIDELARSRGSKVFQQVEQMTRDAMEGRIALDEIFRLRLELIRPTQAEVAALAELYVREVEPTARETIARLRERGWTPAIVSGGYTQAIEPLAAALDIERIEAVRLQFGADGQYAGFDETHPAARKGGKPEVVRRLRHEYGAVRIVMVGDGMSDLETIGAVDVFVGFGRYARRAPVESACRHFILSLSALLNLLE